MNQRERMIAILNYKEYDRIPVVHFGFWRETLEKWAEEGHLTKEEAEGWGDGNRYDRIISEKLGFDCNWANCFYPNTDLCPGFERKVLKTLPDGTRHVRNSLGVVELEAENAGSIPAEIDYLFKGRAEWEKHYKHRFEFDEKRVTESSVRIGDDVLKWNEGGLDYLRNGDRDEMLAIFCGSLFGRIRNFIGVENVSYLFADDEELYDEIIDTVADCCYQCVKYVLDAGAKFDFGHFWEDICFKNGPLVIPSVFDEKVGPHYKRITDLLKEHDIDLVSLDCDGKIDALIPTWLNNGVNVMFPIEVGTWNANIADWRKEYGRDIRGVGGMRKHVFAEGRDAVDAEIERLKELVALGGYIPCPDHRIAPDAEWDNVVYYCERLRDAK